MELDDTCPTLAISESTDFFGGLQCFFPFSIQHKLGKQSNCVLHGFGKKSRKGGGGGVHCK